MRPVPLAAPLLPVTGDVGALGEAERRRRAAFRVAVVSMPWAALRPQIQLGLLARIGRGHGFPVDTHHLALDLAALIPPDETDRLRDFHGLLEWLFGVAAFGPDPDPGDQLLEAGGGDRRRRLAAAGFPPEKLLSPVRWTRVRASESPGHRERPHHSSARSARDRAEVPMMGPSTTTPEPHSHDVDTIE